MRLRDLQNNFTFTRDYSIFTHRREAKIKGV